ncbi:hypothetical protein [Oleiharenicola lentus]|uniref:hypothetical protein n=1 Tax=Oleiharenicola lentus TaxID=2508720 RepID=UPI003F669BA6
MPTSTGGETIGERLTRLRAALARVRRTIERSEDNGGAFTIGGSSVTQIAYERAIEREKELKSEIAALERRIAGGASPRMASLETKMPGSK